MSKLIGIINVVFILILKKKCVVGAPTLVVGASSSGKSWICHCIKLHTVAISFNIRLTQNSQLKFDLDFFQKWQYNVQKCK